MRVSYLPTAVSVIESLPIFSPLSSIEKQYIAAKGQLVEFAKGESLYEEQNPPDYFHCVVNGRIELYHPATRKPKQQRLSIETLRRGDYFGLISSLTGQSHTVSARALNDSLVLRITRRHFNALLHTVPRLAVYVSHALSRRLSQRPHKTVFQSTIIATYGTDDDQDASLYAERLAGSLKQESLKKVLIIPSTSIPRVRDVSSTLSSFTGSFHYIIVIVSPVLTDVNFEILRQSDTCHIISPSDRGSLRKVAALVRRLEHSFGQNARQTVSVIVKEDCFYPMTSYADKCGFLQRDIFASLPVHKEGYDKVTRRIAREVSGAMVGLVLGSGAAMGLAHIGVLKVLEKEKIPIDIVAATSMGALIAALWAAGFSANKIEEIASGLRSKLRVLFLIDPTLPVRGLMKGRAVRKILLAYLGRKTFYDTRLPLRIVACNIEKRTEFIIDRGNLVDAVMASISIPGIFEPVEFRGKVQLVDGGVVNPVPVSVLSKMGIRKIIAVNTLPSPADIVRIPPKRLTIYDVIANSFQAMEYTIALNSCQQADVNIHPIPELADWYEFYKAQSFIKAGQEHTRRLLPRIRALVRR